jgi:aldehyde dehydrogenase (NAD+)
LKFEPTVIAPVGINEPIVNHELFNPLLPVVTFRDQDIDQLLEVISEREHCLALYLFTKDMKWALDTMSKLQYGGGCINEVCMHLTVKGVPFNGVGHSGMGAYHGKWGFMEFTHPSTVLIGRTFGNLPLREHPYGGAAGAIKQKIIRLVER